MRVMTMLLLTGLWAPGFAQAMDCSIANVAQPLRPTVLTPVASELALVGNQLGTPGGVLSQAYDESQSVDQVLLRIRIESCQNVATATPSVVPGVVNPDDPAAYKPRTEFDNTPWRFNMSQNGKNMTADEFTAWMKSRGVRVARGSGMAPPAVSAPSTGTPFAPVASPTVPTGLPPGTLPTESPASPPSADQPPSTPR